MVSDIFISQKMIFMKFTLLVMITSFMMISSANAQKPVRKGVKPIQKESAPPTAKYQLAQLNGKWQEVRRSSRSGNDNIDFTDSLQVFIKGSNGELREGNSMNMYMKGGVRVTAPNLLEIAGDSYTVLSLSGNKLVIDDGEFKRTLEKRNRFYYETLGKNEVKAEELNTPVQAPVSSLKGKWLVYRRQAVPGFITSNTTLIKSIDIRSDSASRYAVGDIVLYKQDLTESFPVRISFEADHMMIQTKEQSWDVFLYKASGNELVFGKTGELVYYAKPL